LGERWIDRAGLPQAVDHTMIDIAMASFIGVLRANRPDDRCSIRRAIAVCERRGPHGNALCRRGGDSFEHCLPEERW
jgi:hypothetical protein